MRISDWSSDVCSSDLAQDSVGKVGIDAYRSGAACPGQVGAGKIGLLHLGDRRLELDPVQVLVALAALRQVAFPQIGVDQRGSHQPGAAQAGAAQVTLHQAGADQARPAKVGREHRGRSEEHTSELQSLMRLSYAVF